MTSRRKTALLRALALAALAGQLAAVADALFVEHVTCLAHGDRIHVTSEAPVAATPWTGLRTPSLAGDEHDHAQCLLDDDVDFIPPPAPAPLPAPAVASDSFPSCVAAAPSVRRSPLYRLAPKNSPPG